MKKWLIPLFVVSLLVSAMLPVSAAQASEDGELCLMPLQETPQTQKEMELYNALSDMNAQYGVMPAAEGGHTVNVTTPVDAQFRSKYASSWAWEVLRAVDDADDYLGQQFNINYNIVSNKYWESANTTSLGALLDEATSEWGLRDNASLMIAFTGRNTDYGGAAYNESKYAIIADQGRATNTLNVQHETGHCYGLTHCNYSSSCIMYVRADVDNLNNLDATCRNYWYNHRLMH